MNTLVKGWFSEISDELWPGQCFSLKVKEILHEEKSEFQDIKILDTETYGKALILDGVIQCTERDEFGYQELISMIPICSHPNPERVLIVGGGDGGVAREAIKHPAVKEVYQVEIDGRVVDLSKKYLPFMACGFDSPKVHLTIGDGFEFMKNHKEEFDVIITDSSDPIGPAVSLFQESYFELMKKALRPGGIICSQGSNFWIDLEHVKETLKACACHFKNTSYAMAMVPSYPCGSIGFVIGCLDEKRDLKTPLHCFTTDQIDKLNFKYYTSDVHKGAFALPRFAAKAFEF
ncbi:CLUMA_CG013191, isoform A [Clunio marinus]|uniref:CLUMA_CG013191, isoform A n=1 Tax=Clunio marinus TaxID=568069 RepID=A0A1J1II65_9DIPT|nr:CLUMA_CG013191, isoform A [Clunio marinus]